jgi:hypothetical protein
LPCPSQEKIQKTCLTSKFYFLVCPKRTGENITRHINFLSSGFWECVCFLNN